MSRYATPDDVRAEARRLGMVNAAVGDVDALERAMPERNSARHRVGADKLRKLGVSETLIRDKYGYVPDPVEAVVPARSLSAA